MTNKQMVEKTQVELERLQTIRKFTLELHNEYFENLFDANHTLIHGLYSTEGNRQTLEKIIKNCEEGYWRTAREASEIDNEIARLLK